MELPVHSLQISPFNTFQLELWLSKRQWDGNSKKLDRSSSSLLVSSSDSDWSREGRKNGHAPNPTAPSHSRLHLSLSKPSWVVHTESNVPKEIRKKPHPLCVVCNGSGRIYCHDCSGKGRTNFTHLVMLPRGEWPKWCKSCRGSGLCYCSRCLGTGEYRYKMGFQFMRSEINDTQLRRQNPGPERPGPHIAADQLLNGELEQENGKLGM